MTLVAATHAADLVTTAADTPVVVDRFDYAEFTRVNTEHKRATGSYLVDIEFMQRIAAAKLDPERYDTSLPAMAEGVREIVVDIFKKDGGMREVKIDDPLEAYDLPFVQPVHAVADAGADADAEEEIV